MHAKLTATDVNAVLTDYDLPPDDADLRLVQGAVRLSAHILARDPAQFRSQLYGRLLTSSEPHLRHLKEQASKSTLTPWARSLQQTLTPPGGPLVRTLSGHSASVSAIAVTPGSCHVISASWDQTLKVWELSSGREVRTLSGHSDGVYAVAVTADGRYVISGSGDRTLKVWELSSGRAVRTLSGHSAGVNAVAVTADGRQVISGAWDHTLKVWELSSGREVRTLSGHSDWVNAVAVTADGRQVISGSDDQTLKVWELSSGREVVTFTVEAPIMCCAVAPDGRMIVAGDQSGRVHFLRVEGIGG